MTILVVLMWCSVAYTHHKQKKGGVWILWGDLTGHANTTFYISIHIGADRQGGVPWINVLIAKDALVARILAFLCNEQNRAKVYFYQSLDQVVQQLPSRNKSSLQLFEQSTTILIVKTDKQTALS